ncbi:MAG: 1-acyl-sn-glycerol-3-phosphate acyltransferase [Muribaculum sp.]|nr:1-acyl-sn-glycerol-3-phosphate acyltransferase [Muribaculum sp.]
MNLWGRILKWRGWTVDITAPQREKCVICVAPHTSNWDFIIGLAAYKSLGREANFLMKKFWFFFPLKYLLKALGGIPVARGGKGGGLTENIIETFKKRRYMNLAVTPEGTRSQQAEWHTGFLRIAYGAGVPLQLGVIDYQNKKVIIKEELALSGDIRLDMEAVKKFYAAYASAARYPELFTI